MTTISVKVQAKEALKLKQYAAHKRVSKSQLIRDYIQGLSVPKKLKPSLYEQMKDLIGSVDSGVTDKSTNPKYMKGFGKWRR